MVSRIALDPTLSATANFSGGLRAIHVHHGLAASDTLEKAAVGIAECLSIPLDVVAVRLEKFTEEAARNARYQALTTGLAEGEWVLTAHTADDQAETVLANLLRGTGSGGLAGIPTRRQSIARPMLDVTRSETRELATLAELPWADDPTNLDLGPLRNRIRLQLIPQLEAEFNPAIRRHLAIAARAFSEANLGAPEVGEAMAGGWRVPVGVLWALGPEVGTRALRAIVRKLRNGYGLDRNEAERVWEVVSGRVAAAEVGGKIRVERLGPWVQLTTQVSDRPG
jgi:tRNA(Ile)-lysidine synthase